MNFSLPLLPLAFDTEWIVPTVFFFFVFGGGGVIMKVVESMNRTRVELTQLRAQQQSSAGNTQEIAALRDEVASLRREVTQLRDTTMQYDLSFDTALQRVESRVQHVEQQQQQVRS